MSRSEAKNSFTVSETAPSKELWSQLGILYQ
ncbi:MAG: hypothetical protein MSA89_09380 [Clostridium sp.]|nr:hypothetical protein [Clostridium sp.]